MEDKNQIYLVSPRDTYKTTERRTVTETSLREDAEFNPAYEELKADFNPNQFSARSCRCHPDRC